MTKKGYHPNLPPEKKKAYNAKQRLKYNAATPEQRQVRSDKRNAYEKKRFEQLSPEEQETFKIKRRKRWLKFQENMSPEQKKSRYEETLKRNMKNYNNLSEEDKEKRLSANRERDKLRREKVRYEVLSHYCGGIPHCLNPNCEVIGGVKNINGLCLEHIDGTGYKHRAKGVKGTALYRWVKRHDFPGDFTVWCATCNQIKKIEQEEDKKARLEKLKNGDISEKKN